VPAAQVFRYGRSHMAGLTAAAPDGGGRQQVVGVITIEDVLEASNVAFGRLEMLDDPTLCYVGNACHPPALRASIMHSRQQPQGSSALLLLLSLQELLQQEIVDETDRYEDK
jgi:hypothetical protein